MRSALILCLALASPVAAVDAKSIVIDEVAQTITITRTDGTVKAYSWAAAAADGISESERAAAQAELQGFYDVLLRQNQLPADDPDRLADPDHACAFWADAQGVRDPAGNRIMYRGTYVEIYLIDATTPGLRMCTCQAYERGGSCG